jgi:acyl-CoA thioesterase YciA
MSDPYVALQIVMLPKDANPLLTPLQGKTEGALYSTIFGGVILSYIDMAGATAARREVALRGGAPDTKIVTVAINRVEFKQPVLVGDVVRFETTVGKLGRTSITMRINVVAERAGQAIRVTEAEVVYVGVDENRRPLPLLPGGATAAGGGGPRVTE